MALPPRRRRGLAGRALAAVALLAQLAAWTLVPAIPVASAEGQDGICHASAGEGAPDQPTGHTGRDCALCPFCLNFAAPPPLHAAEIRLPEPPLAAIVPTVVLPPATAPPNRPSTTASPRGPPAPI